VGNEARFFASCGTRLDHASPFASSGGRDELHPVTALFSEVVGSTALGERLSAEEIKVLIGECVSSMAISPSPSPSDSPDR
jgi:hypothetical protein